MKPVFLLLLLDIGMSSYITASTAPVTVTDDFVAYIQRAANGDSFGLRADGRFYP
jgi:hypothetical protein